MKLFLLFASLLAFTACNSSSGSSSNKDPQVNENAITEANINTLTSTRWCAEHDGDNDGKIGTFLFNKDGNVDWIGYDLRTQKAYGHDKMKWKLETYFLQIGRQISTHEGSRIAFTGFGSQTRMSWVDDTNLPPTQQDPNAPTMGTSKPASYIAVPCNLDL